jgi:hypothetical protein
MVKFTIRTSTDVVRTSACIRVDLANAFLPTDAFLSVDAFLPTNAFLPSAPTVKKRFRADGLMHPRGCAHASVQTQARLHVCVHASARIQTRPRGHDYASART